MDQRIPGIVAVVVVLVVAVTIARMNDWWRARRPKSKAGEYELPRQDVRGVMESEIAASRAKRAEARGIKEQAEINSPTSLRV